MRIMFRFKKKYFCVGLFGFFLTTSVYGLSPSCYGFRVTQKLQEMISRSMRSQGLYITPFISNIRTTKWGFDSVDCSAEFYHQRKINFSYTVQKTEEGFSISNLVILYIKE